MGFFTINKRFLPIKFHYGMFNAGTATVQPTMPVYAKELGFSSSVVGTIYTVLPLVGLFIKPIFGSIADKFKWHRGVLITWIILVLATYFSIQFIPPDQAAKTSAARLRSPHAWAACSPIQQFESKPFITTELGRNIWKCAVDDDICQTFNVTHFCNEDYREHLGTPGRCVLQPQIPAGPPPKFLEGCIRTPRKAHELPDSQAYGQYQFWVFLVLMIGAFGGTSVVTTLSDTICIEICGDPHIYGRQRLWGSLGWAVLVVINGLVMDAVSTDDEKNYMPAFYLMLAPMIIDVVIAYYMKFSIPQQSANIAMDVFMVMFKPRALIFALWCAMFGIALGLLWNFQFWLLEDLATEMGPDTFANIKTIEGLVSAATCVLGEVPAFFICGQIVDKIGHGNALSLEFILIGIRFSAYYALVNPWWSIPLEIFQTHFGLFYCTMTSYAKLIGTPGTEATVQSILCAIAEGVGVAIGSFVGGLLYDRYGGSMTFLIYGIGAFVVAAINICIELYYKYKEKSEIRSGQNVESLDWPTPNHAAS